MPYDEEPHLRESELALRWRLSRRTLQRWRKLGKGPPWLKVGDRILYPSDGVRNYEHQSRGGAQT